ncbi:MAG: zinc ribbon domain-containing protein [Deltaproteobacteria bacterium]|nr:zinc ribbon domain-containing protein [Deltaproteobacteria bacterium]
MPIYEYSCRTCGYRFEKVQKSGTEHETTCPNCDSAEVQKELSSFSTGASSSSACFSGG